MSDKKSETPRTVDLCARLWKNAGTGLEMIDHASQLERELNYAVNCINAIESHYKAKHGESYEHTTLHTIIENWRNK